MPRGRDLVPLQAVRVPAPVPALMVVAGDVTGIVIGPVLPQLLENVAYYYACDISRHYHERWDGGGYPDGLLWD